MFHLQSRSQIVAGKRLPKSLGNGSVGRQTFAQSLKACTSAFRVSPKSFVSVANGLSFVRTFAETTNQAIHVERADADDFRIEVPLANGEKCLFTFHEDQTVKNFLDDMKAEDPTIKNIHLLTEKGARVAQSTKFSQIFPSNLKLSINGTDYKVLAPQAVEQLTKKSEHDKLLAEFVPLYKKKREMDAQAYKRSNFLIWGGFGFLCAQFAFMARLVWWEYNWDIMEPVSYFITFGTALIGYSYFALAKREYTYNDVRESFAVSRMRKLYEKNEFPVDKYFYLEHQLKERDPLAVAQVEYDLEEKEFKKEN